MNKDVTRSSFYKAFCTQIHNWSNEYPRLEKELSGPLQQLDVVRKHYSSILVLDEIIKRCLTLEGDIDERRNKALRELREAFSLIELRFFICPPTLLRDGQALKIREDSAASALFDLNRKSLHEKAKEKVTKRHLEILKEDIQNCLLQRCNQIISFTFPEETFPPSKGMTAVVTHFSELKRKSNSQRNLVAKQQHYNIGLLKMIFQQLVEYGTSLRNLIEKHRFSEHLVPHLKYLLLSIKVYTLKLSCLEREILTYTYSKESVSFLKQIKGGLDKKSDVVTRSLAQVDHRLSAYQGLNPRFYELLREFSNLQKDLQFLKT